MNRAAVLSIGPARARRMVTTAAIAVVAVVLTACGSESGGRAGDTDPGPSIVASTDVYGNIAQVVAGDHAKVTSIIDDATADPHSYEASTRNILAVSRADIVIENGGGYDDFMHTLRDSAGNSGAEVLDAVTISGKQAKSGGELNEHVWYDFESVIRLTGRIRDALVEVDPTNADDYRANARKLTDELEALGDRATRIGAVHPNATAAVTEPVPSYLLDAVGLENRTPAAFGEAVEAGEAVSPAVLAGMLDLFRENPVDVLVVNTQTTDDQTAQVVGTARANGVPVVSVTETLPRGTSYVAWMQANLDAISSALDGDRERPETTGS